jgi:hypothetical protein
VLPSAGRMDVACARRKSGNVALPGSIEPPGNDFAIAAERERMQSACCHLDVDKSRWQGRDVVLSVLSAPPPDDGRAIAAQPDTVLVADVESGVHDSRRQRWDIEHSDRRGAPREDQPVAAQRCGMGRSRRNLDIGEPRRQGRNVALSAVIATPSDRRAIASKGDTVQVACINLDVRHANRQGWDEPLAVQIAAPVHARAVIEQTKTVTVACVHGDVGVSCRRCRNLALLVVALAERNRSAVGAHRHGVIPARRHLGVGIVLRGAVEDLPSPAEHFALRVQGHCCEPAREQEEDDAQSRTLHGASMS